MHACMHTHTHTHTHCSDIWTDLSVQKCYWLILTVLDFGTWNHLPWHWIWWLAFHDSTFKIVISSEKLKRGWTLTTSQYTITHIVYFKTQRTAIENTKVNKQTSNLLNSHTYTHTHTHTHIHAHTLLWRLNGFICSEMLLTNLTVLDFGTWNHLPWHTIHS